MEPEEIKRDSTLQTLDATGLFSCRRRNRVAFGCGPRTSDGTSIASKPTDADDRGLESGKLEDAKIRNAQHESVPSYKGGKEAGDHKEKQLDGRGFHHCKEELAANQGYVESDAIDSRGIQTKLNDKPGTQKRGGIL